MVCLLSSLALRVSIGRSLFSRFDFAEAFVEVAELDLVAIEPGFVVGGLFPESLLGFGGLGDGDTEFGRPGHEDREFAVDHEHPRPEGEEGGQDDGDDDFVFLNGHGG